MSAEVAVLHHAPDRVGESPLWDAAEGCLWWVDILGHAIRRADLETCETRSFELGVPPGALALGEDGSLIAAAGRAWIALDRATGVTRQIAKPDAPAQDWRMNDGCVDTGGRFWAGSIDEPRGSGAGGILWRLGPSGPVEVLRGLGVQNGMAVSPDGATLYLSDSHPSAAVIWAFDLDAATGEVANRRVFHRPETGRPDGGTTDINGCYWFAAIDAGRIVQLDPKGREIRTIDLPVSRPTKPAFCGPDLSTLAVTTMSEGTEGEALAGAVLLLDPGTRGWPLPRARM